MFEENVHGGFHRSCSYVCIWTLHSKEKVRNNVRITPPEKGFRGAASRTTANKYRIWHQPVLAANSPLKKYPLLRSSSNLCPPVCIGGADTGKDPCFVNVQPTAVFAENIKPSLNLLHINISSTGTGCPVKSSRFESDKLVSYFDKLFVESLMGGRTISNHIRMRGCRHIAPLLVSTVCIVYWTSP